MRRTPKKTPIQINLTPADTAALDEMAQREGRYRASAARECVIRELTRRGFRTSPGRTYQEMARTAASKKPKAGTAAARAQCAQRLHRDRLERVAERREDTAEAFSMEPSKLMPSDTLDALPAREPQEDLPAVVVPEEEAATWPAANPADIFADLAGLPQDEPTVVAMRDRCDEVVNEAPEVLSVSDLWPDVEAPVEAPTTTPTPSAVVQQFPTFRPVSQPPKQVKFEMPKTLGVPGMMLTRKEPRNNG